MDRRNFLCRVTAATAGAGATVEAAKAGRTVTYDIKGFTCVTCAVGLEVMLRGLKGVLRATASYPGNKAVIEYDEQATSEKNLKQFIAACGFSVAEKS